MGEKKRRQALGLDRSRSSRETEVLIGGILPYEKAIRLYDEDCHALMMDIPFPAATYQGTIPVHPEGEFALLRLGGLGRRDMHRVFPEITKGSAPEKLDALLTASKEMISRRVDPFIQQVMSEVRDECGAGCSMCCHQDVEVAVPEAITIARQLGDPDDPRREKIRQRAAGLRAGTTSGSAPCPLLGDDGNCTVYEVRPLVCRQYYSTSRQRCLDAFEAFNTGVGDKTVHTYAEPQFVARSHLGSVLGICKDAGAQYGMVPLSTAVEQILDDPTIPDRWSAGERVFEREDTGPPPPSMPKLRLHEDER